MFMAALSGANAQLGPENCGPINNAFGPFDYRTTRGFEIDVVERAHFTSSVESLVRGKSATLGGDIDYTLRAFPNHHRALVSMMRLGEREQSPKASGANYEVECYFVRAVTFKPDDIVARMLFSSFLLKAKRRDEALLQLALAQPYASDNPFSHYNLGLSFFEASKYDEALKHAHRAMSLGFPRTDLKDRLLAKGHWQDPTLESSETFGPTSTRDTLLVPAEPKPSTSAPASASASASAP